MAPRVKAVGRGERDAPDLVVAQELLDLGGYFKRLDVSLRFLPDYDRIENGGELSGGKFDVDDDAQHLDHLTDRNAGSLWFSFSWIHGLTISFCRSWRIEHNYSQRRASAPDTISRSSLVMID